MSSIEANSLCKKFGTFTAVDDVSLHVKPGEILALLGPNGAGKTTTIRMLASILKPTGGSAKIAGYDIAHEQEAVRSVVGLLTEQHGLYHRMRADEYLNFFGSIYGLDPSTIQQRTRTLLGEYKLQESSGLRLGQYSKGMRQKLALVRALLHEPQILLLDEPTSAMDPESAHHVRSSIVELRSADRAIIVCTHNLFEAEALADRIAIIRRGKIIANDSPVELKRKMVGDPVMELRLACSLDGALAHLPKGIVKIASGEDWVRYSTSQAEVVNPQILNALAKAGIPVVTLSRVERSLEEVYLQVVSEDDSQEGINDDR
ncbi:MAG: ABC transporter ATP-binding protein [Anaerolineales bacterium]|jgi:ABC-2 type transport system ATP-binding protein|nr:ABC transporter ATP-binding protein [Anaerolineales bacterium]